jgi:hypothetical protein
MNDTTPEIAALYRNLIMNKSGEERLLMGCSMYDAARQIVRSAIYNDRPGITEKEIKKEIFLRFYGREFSMADREKFISVLMAK